MNVFFQHLDLSDSPLDSRCCSSLCNLVDLRVLMLDRCNLDTGSASDLIQRLTKLTQFNCDNCVQDLMAGGWVTLFFWSYYMNHSCEYLGE